MHESECLLYLRTDILCRQGFFDFDPFIPIKVDKFTDKELESMLDYFQDRQFLTRPESMTPEGRAELKFMSSNLPENLYRFCRTV